MLSVETLNEDVRWLERFEPGFRADAFCLGIRMVLLPLLRQERSGTRWYQVVQRAGMGAVVTWLETYVAKNCGEKV
jgi:hypothetical protein